MMRALLLCSVVFVLAGCGRSDSPLESSFSTPAEQVLLVGGFNESDQVVLGEEWFRVGGYYDFSMYDQITITFTARREGDGPETGHITVKVGPTTYVTDSISVNEREVMFRLSTPNLSKPRMSAITFINPDPATTLRLSGLRVIGWTTR